MFCIAAFIIFAILGIFSASYRKLAKKAWYCVLRRITFKPCDINFSEEVKGRLLGKIIIKKPRLAKFLSTWFDWMALVFVLLTLWSVWAVFWAGLNLWVYDTCDPGQAESCSLAGEACSIESRRISFFDAIQYNLIGEWTWQSITDAGETFSRIPDRLKEWKAEDYLPSSATFYYNYDENKPYAVEAIDPSCQFCRKLFENIKTTGFEEHYNFAYILFPIPDPNEESGYKFPNSYLMASYIEATKKVPLTRKMTDNSADNGGDLINDNNPANNDSTPAEGEFTAQENVSPDWQLLEKIFTATNTDGELWQTLFVEKLTAEEAETQLQKFLAEIGYHDEEIAEIAELAHNDETQKALAEQRNLVENKIKTVKIPTIIFKNRRFDRVIDGNILSDS